MNNEPSIVKRTESTFDDLVDLWRRRPCVCVIVIVVIIIPTLFSLYLKFVAVPNHGADITRKDSEIKTLQSSVTKTEHERDKAQLQLAPYLAAEERGFPDVPTDKRADLLLARLDLAIRSVQDAALRLSLDRRVSSEVSRAMIADLKTISPMNVEVVCVLGDTEAFALATQIKGIFEEAGWKVNGLSQAIFTTPIGHLVLTFGKEPPPRVQQALAPLFNSLGYPREASLDQRLGESNLKIIIGAK